MCIGVWPSSDYDNDNERAAGSKMEGDKENYWEKGGEGEGARGGGLTGVAFPLWGKLVRDVCFSNLVIDVQDRQGRQEGRQKQPKTTGTQGSLISLNQFVILDES